MPLFPLCFFLRQPLNPRRTPSPTLVASSLTVLTDDSRAVGSQWDSGFNFCLLPRQELGPQDRHVSGSYPKVSILLLFLLFYVDELGLAAVASAAAARMLSNGGQGERERLGLIRVTLVLGRKQGDDAGEVVMLSEEEDRYHLPVSVALPS